MFDLHNDLGRDQWQHINSTVPASPEKRISEYLAPLPADAWWHEARLVIKCNIVEKPRCTKVLYVIIVRRLLTWPPAGLESLFLGRRPPVSTITLSAADIEKYASESLP